MTTVGCYHLSLIKRHICFKAQWLLWSLKMLICCVLSSFKSFDSVPTNVGKCCASPFLASCFIGCRCRVVVVIVDVVATSHPRWPDLRRFKALSDIGIWFYRSVRAPSFFVLLNCTSFYLSLFGSVLVNLSIIIPITFPLSVFLNGPTPASFSFIFV